jgi:hypothetical protein
MDKLPLLETGLSDSTAIHWGIPASSLVIDVSKEVCALWTGQLKSRRKNHPRLIAATFLNLDKLTDAACRGCCICFAFLRIYENNVPINDREDQGFEVESRPDGTLELFLNRNLPIKVFCEPGKYREPSGYVLLT